MTTKRTETVRTTDVGQTFAVVVRYSLAREIADDLQTALEQFTAIVEKVYATESRRESTAT
jgi:hypothetical protein